MSPIEIRAIEPSDMYSVSALFDTTLGAGFWELDLGAGPSAVAVSNDEIIGAASANVAEALDEMPGLPGPVGVVRLVAVRADSRRRGVASQLVRTVCHDCLRGGAASLAAFAWVYGDTGACPLAGVLERLGFSRLARFEGFYAGSGIGACPQCGGYPCSCSADLYVSRPFAEETDPRWLAVEAGTPSPIGDTPLATGRHR